MRDTIRKSANRYARVPRKARQSSAAELRMAANRARTAQALRDNKCPTCGRAVRVNLSLTGWVQCTQFGAREFRVDPDNMPCDWQGFTS